MDMPETQQSNSRNTLMQTAPNRGKLLRQAQGLTHPMVRAIATLVLVVAAIAISVTNRGSAVLGFARPLMIAALILLGLLQAARLARLWQEKRRPKALDEVPKRPLGL